MWKTRNKPVINLRTLVVQWEDVEQIWRSGYTEQNPQKHDAVVGKICKGEHGVNNKYKIKCM